METIITKGIALEARGKFVDYITSTVNTMYYIHNSKETPVSGVVDIESLGLSYGDIVISSRNPEEYDDYVVGIEITPTRNSFVVSGFIADGNYDIPCQALGLDQLCAVSNQFENKFNRK